MSMRSKFHSTYFIHEYAMRIYYGLRYHAAHVLQIAAKVRDLLAILANVARQFKNRHHKNTYIATNVHDEDRQPVM